MSESVVTKTDWQEQIRLLECMLDVARQQRDSSYDFLRDLGGGRAVGLEAAAYIAGVSSETVRRWCIEGEDVGAPIGIKHTSGAWLLDVHLLLDRIQSKGGLPARLVAETRWRKQREMSLRAHSHLQTVEVSTTSLRQHE